MPKHTEAEMEQLSLEDLKKGADEEAAQARDEQGRFVKTEEAKTTEQEEADPEIFIARREIDLGDGSGIQVFESEGESEKEALEALADKIADAQRNATKKIREQEAELKDLRAKTSKPPEPKTITDDEEYVFAQEIQKKPVATLRKMWKELTGYELEDFVTAKQAADAVIGAQKQGEALNTFIATHPEYQDDGEDGKYNGELMKMKLAELRLPITSENLSKAYSSLKNRGFLRLKGEEAHADATKETAATSRIEKPAVEVAQTRTKKTSGISTHSRTTTVPLNTEPSEDELYKMPMDKLRELANKQLATAR